LDAVIITGILLPGKDPAAWLRLNQGTTGTIQASKDGDFALAGLSE